MGIFDSAAKFVTDNAGTLAGGAVAVASAAGAYAYRKEIVKGAKRAGRWASELFDGEEETAPRRKRKHKKASSKKTSSTGNADKIARALSRDAERELKRLSSEQGKAIVAEARREAEKIRAEARQATQAALEIIKRAEDVKTGSGGTGRTLVRKSAMTVPKNKKQKVAQAA